MLMDAKAFVDARTTNEPIRWFFYTASSDRQLP